MKELSIEEKAKTYDKIIEFAYNKHRFSSNLSEIKLIEEMFPELKESEDEKIKKNIKIALMSMEDNLADFYSTHRTSQKELLAWLEKQEEQKSTWSEEDMKMIGTLVAIFEVNYPNSFYKVNPIGTTNMQGIHSSEIIKWLKSLKERYTWKPTKEQMHYLYWIANIKLGDSMVEQEVSKHLNELYEDLKRLRKE